MTRYEQALVDRNVSGRIQDLDSTISKRKRTMEAADLIWMEHETAFNQKDKNGIQRLLWALRIVIKNYEKHLRPHELLQLEELIKIVIEIEGL
ncbi:MAG: hypothetical protein JWN76_1674 [Chitinophagaceae bacterium]|nr:hypothetical protein [Chitinophagaceae bacterium]